MSQYGAMVMIAVALPFALGAVVGLVMFGVSLFLQRVKK